eukprot:5519636-Prymnesium_polylepis.1
MRRYLQADLSVNCASGDYQQTRTVAFMLIAVWPVGIPLMYGALLRASRKALITGVPTPLSRSVAFLADDCEPIANSTPAPQCDDNRLRSY